MCWRCRCFCGPAAVSEQRFEQCVGFDPAAPSLEELELSLNEAGVGGARALADAISGKTRLKKLNLSENELEDRGALLIAKALKGLPALQVVDLTINQVGDPGCQGRAGLPAVHALDLMPWSAPCLSGGNMQSICSYPGH